MNLAEALVQLGEWGAAEAESAQAVSSHGLGDMEPRVSPCWTAPAPSSAHSP